MFRNDAALFLSLIGCGPAMAASPAYHAEVAADAPVLWYQLNEATGNAINFGSLGGAFDAAYNGTIGRAVPTSAGDAGVQFSGADDYLESSAASPAAFNGNPTFSAEAVVFIPSGGTAALWPPFLHWGDPPSGSRTGREVYFSLAANLNNRVFNGFYNGGLRSGVPILLNAWNHIVWVRQGGGDAITGSTMYINAVAVATIPDPGLCCDTLIPDVTSSNFRINRARDLTRFFQGTLDEVVLYDRALSEADVCRHFKAFYQVLPGDMNCDGVASVADIGGFVLALTNPAQYTASFPCCNILAADLNGDLMVTVSDIGLFVALLTG